MSGNAPSSRQARRRPANADVSAGEAAIAWAVGHGASARVSIEVAATVRRMRRRRRCIALGGTVAALAFAGAGWAWLARPAAPVVTIAVADARRLPDGSTVQLKDDAEVAVDFSGRARVVTLLRGEAHFDVAPNPARVFIVDAGGVVARAVGTAFSVSMTSREVEVLVTEGRVAVDVERAAPAAADPAASSTTAPADVSLVDAGSRVRIGRGAAATGPRVIEPVPENELQARLAWRAPRFEFSGTPLAEVAQVFRRHSGIRIVLADPSLARLQVSGVLRGDNADALLRLLEIEFGLKTERRGGGEFVVRP